MHLLNILNIVRKYILRSLIKGFLKSTLRYEKNIISLMNIEFDSKNVYGNSDKYLNTKIKVNKR